MGLSIQIFSCGGTIDKVYFDRSSEYLVGEPLIGGIFREARVGFEYRVESLMRKDSSEMTDADRQLVRDRVASAEGSRILITHGTDTMAETARWLEGIPGKVIVLTGSLTPLRFRESDAVFNLGLAVGALLSRSPGVYVAMNGQVFSSDNVRKNHELGRFEVLREDS